MLESLHSGTKGIQVTMEVRSGVQNFEKDSQRFTLYTGYLVSLQDFERKITYGLITSRTIAHFVKFFTEIFVSQG
jgi:hypothetical protein